MYVASSIGISDAWSSDSSLFMDSCTSSDLGSYYALFANALQNSSNTVPTSVSGATTYSGSLSNYADTFTQEIASSINTITEEANWNKTNVDNIDQQRQSISSVSTDDEGVNIIKYQQAYSANARVITTIDEMLDKLINSTGTVGISG
jgi:flagellar hook-associated protein 1 FlgK